MEADEETSFLHSSAAGMEEGSAAAPVTGGVYQQ